MRFVQRFINHTEYNALEVIVNNQDDENELLSYQDIKTVCVSMEYAKYLYAFNSVEILILTSGKSSNEALEAIYFQKSIRALKIDYYYEDFNDSKYQIDLSEFPSLEYLFTRSSRNVINLDRAPLLRTLVFGKYMESDLSELKNCKIDSLAILTGRNLQFLNGIESIPIRLLSIGYSRIVSLKPLSECNKLEMLELDHCRRIRDLSGLYNENLRRLFLFGEQEIPSLEPLRRLSRLKYIALEWKVRDHDLSVLDTFEDASLIQDRAKYNRKDKDLPKAKIPYVVAQIPRWRYYYPYPTQE